MTFYQVHIHLLSYHYQLIYFAWMSAVILLQFQFVLTNFFSFGSRIRIWITSQVLQLVKPTDQNQLRIGAYNWERQTLLSIYLLRPSDYCYMIKMKNMLDAASPTPWSLINSLIREASSPIVALGHLPLELLTKNLMARKLYWLLTDFGSKT